MTKVIGLTGGIGSGKTTVANLFLKNGIPVYIADEESKKLLDTIEISEAIEREFGQSIVTEGKIDRSKLATIVFENPERLSALNSILHPAVKTHFLNWVASHKNNAFVVKEAAILFESGNDEDCDTIITVTAPLELKIDRVMKRDSTTRENVLKRMANQWTDEKKIAKSDFVIQNTSLQETEGQFSKILKNLQNI